MSGLVEVWAVEGGTLKRRGRADDDGFVLGLTEPTRDNTGVLPDVTRSNYSGTFDFTSPNQTFENLNISSQVTVTGSGHKFHNCKFTYTHTGFDGGGLVSTRSASCNDITFERCTFSPSGNNEGFDAVYGHHFTAYRCLIEHTNDGFGVVNPWAQPVNTNISGCWIGDLSWYANDDGAHSDGTHNDGIQHHSGTGLDVIGNTFYAYKYNVLGTPDLDSSANNLWPQQFGQLTLHQHSAYYLVGDIRVNNNFVYGGDQGFKAMSNRSASIGGGKVPFAIEVKNNTWLDSDQRIYSVRVPIRIDTNITLNGQTYPVSIRNVDTNGNKWANVADVDVDLRGTSVNIVTDQA